MALQECLNPPPVIAAVAALIDIDSYLAVSPDGAQVPYLLFGYNPDSAPGDDAVDGVQDWADDLYITITGDTPGNVEAYRSVVRAALNPAGRGVSLALVGGGRAWLKRTEFGSPVTPDVTAPKLASTNQHPLYAMDAYRVYPN